METAAVTKFVPALLLSLPILAGCSTEAPSPTPAAVAPAEATQAVTRAQIETCWNAAGIGGKGYKLLTTAEALALQPDGSISADQAEAFGACLRT